CLPPTTDNVDLLTTAADGQGPLVPYLRSPKPINEASGRFSPDGRWIAYQSNESGRTEIYVQSFPPSGGKWQISTNGGLIPMWRGDGKEIIYQAPGDTFYAVPVKPAAAGLDVGAPEKLFQHRLAHNQPERNRWAVTRDGQPFLL